MCRGALKLVPAHAVEQSANDVLSCSCGQRYPVSAGIPRFVPPENYTSNFGLQWNRFRRTQLDSYSGLPISRERFYSFSGWSAEELEGKLLLDAGCGAGRFTEIALAAGAQVVAVDLSNAVDACAANFQGHERLHVVQADLYRLPFLLESFDYVYCFGVLQHTPDVHAAFQVLPRQLKPGGSLAIDIYPLLWRNLLWSKYWLRPFTRRVPREQLFQAVQQWTPRLLRWSRRLARTPLLGRQLKYALPVVNYDGVYPLSQTQLQEWAVLDTFDMLAPRHDHPQSARSLYRWLREAGLAGIQVERRGFLVGRATRPLAP